jgi:translation initiation factor IF-3
MTITGEIKRILETKEVGTNNFKTRDVDVTTDEQYPQTIRIQFVQEKTALLDSVTTGQKVTIAINIKGREYIKEDASITVFNTINGWKIN